MKGLKLTVTMLLLGVITCNPKANATDLSTTTQLKSKSELELVQVNTFDFIKYYNKGVDRVISTDYQGAINDFTKAIKINPNYALAYLNRSTTRLILEDYTGAIADSTKAIEINPNYAKVYYNRGNARGLSGDIEGGIIDLQKAAELFQKQGRKAEDKPYFKTFVVRASLPVQMYRRLYEICFNN